MPNRFNNGAPTYTDGTEIQGNRKNQWIEFYHIPTGRSVSFKAFLTDFSDDYKSNWNLETVMGRMDPLPTFTNTTRTISVGWDVPAATGPEAEQNFERVQTLNDMLYPVYENGIMAGGPLFKVRMMNFVKDGSSSGISGASESGLIAIIDGFSFNPDLDAGFIEYSRGRVFPKNIKMSCTMNIQHSSQRGTQRNRTPIDRHQFERNQRVYRQNMELRRQNNRAAATAALAAAERRREGAGAGGAPGDEAGAAARRIGEPSD